MLNQEAATDIGCLSCSSRDRIEGGMKELFILSVCWSWRWPSLGRCESDVAPTTVTVKSRFAGMVQYNVGDVGKQLILLRCWWSHSMGAGKRRSWLSFDVLQVWRSDE